MSVTDPDPVPPLRNPFPATRYCCATAERFAAWVDRLLARLTQDDAKQPTLPQVWEAKAKLLDEYRKERHGATRAHRDRLADKAGDPCLHGVFIAALERIADIVIDPTITPPPRVRAKKSEERATGWMEELAKKLTTS